jgi:crotonobetainyl-CoA:carnitine CoA-transferase CaiB-like acyl-CoA transferase
VGNDRQWKAMVSQEIFKSLDKPLYETNKGRIEDVQNLNDGIGGITKNHTSEELIDLFNAITVPISKISTVPEVMADPLVEKVMLSSEDPISGAKISMPPSPHMTPFLEEMNRKLPFPPRFGEHNREIYGEVLGYSGEEIDRLKETKVI